MSIWQYLVLFKLFQTDYQKIIAQTCTNISGSQIQSVLILSIFYFALTEHQLVQKYWCFRRLTRHTCVCFLLSECPCSARAHLHKHTQTHTLPKHAREIAQLCTLDRPVTTGLVRIDLALHRLSLFPITQQLTQPDLTMHSLTPDTYQRHHSACLLSAGFSNYQSEKQKLHVPYLALQTQSRVNIIDFFHSSPIIPFSIGSASCNYTLRLIFALMAKWICIFRKTVQETFIWRTIYLFIYPLINYSSYWVLIIYTYVAIM